MGAISYSRYTLNPRDRLSARVTAHSRDGALLRVQWANGLVGYADLFPWPEFGDLTLEQELMALANDRPTPLVRRALELAEWDAGLRQKGQAVWTQEGVQNHALIHNLDLVEQKDLDRLWEQGFRHLKIKVDGKDNILAHKCKPILGRRDFLVRLDFNATGNVTSFQNFCHELTDEEKAQVEFVEDPMPWSLSGWQIAARELPLALDFEERHVEWRGDSLPFHFVIAKPTRKSVAELLEKVQGHGTKICITSAMDHPVGVATAAAQIEALQAAFGKDLVRVHGLLSLDAYEPTKYTEEVQIRGPVFKGVRGTGIGFDSLLASEPWEELRP